MVTLLRLIVGMNGRRGVILYNTVQVHGSLISSDGSADVEVLAINAASAALATSDIPWAGNPSPAWHACLGAAQARYTIAVVGCQLL